MQGGTYVDSSLKDANFAEPSEQLLCMLALLSASPQMLTELTDAKLNALKVSLLRVLAAVNAELQTKLHSATSSSIALLVRQPRTALFLSALCMSITGCIHLFSLRAAH